MEKLIELLKELRLFLAFLMSSGLVAALDIDTVMDYILLYNIHLVLLIGSGIYINHFLSNKRHIRTEYTIANLQVQLNEVILKSRQEQLKADIRQAYKDYYNIQVIDFPTTIKVLRGLENRRIELKVNSEYQEMLSILLAKIRIK